MSALEEYRLEKAEAACDEANAKLRAAVNEAQDDLDRALRAEAKAERWEWIARHRRSLVGVRHDESVAGIKWAVVRRDEDGPGGDEVGWLAARYEECEE